MLSGIHPLLGGEILLHLDQMGHSDAVVVADAHFPARALGARFVDLPGCSAPDLLGAIRTVLPLDEAPSLDLMASASGQLLEVQSELLATAGVEEAAARFLSRERFYQVAASAYLIVRTGETRTYANALLRKGVVGHPVGDWAVA